MQFRMFGVVFGAIVEAAVPCQLDAIDELDVGALIDLGRMTRSEVGDQKAKRPACTFW